MGRTACKEPQYLYKLCNLNLPYSRAIPLLPICAVRPVQRLSACVRGAIYIYLTVELYLYFPYGPYVLYRASVPVQGCTLLYLTVELHLNSPYGPYGLYRASVPVQSALYLYLRVKLYLYSPYEM